MLRRLREAPMRKLLMDLLAFSTFGLVAIVLLWAISPDNKEVPKETENLDQNLTSREIVQSYAQGTGEELTNKQFVLDVSGMQRHSESRHVWRSRAGGAPWLILDHPSQDGNLPRRVLVLCKGPDDHGVVHLVWIRPAP